MRVSISVGIENWNNVELPFIENLLGITTGRIGGQELPTKDGGERVCTQARVFTSLIM